MIGNYKNLINDLGLIAYNHNQVNSFAFRDITNVTSQITGFLNQHLEPSYIRVYIVPGPVTLEQSQIRYNFNIIFMDRLEEDLSNQIDVLNDTLEVAKDFYTILLNNYDVDFGEFTEFYDPAWGATTSPFLERFETVLAGHTLSLDIIQPFEYICDLPITGVTLPDSDEIYNVNYKQVVNDLLMVGNNHQQLHSVGFGDIPQLVNDIVNHTEPMYPRMYIVPDETILSQNQIKYSFDIIVSDRLEEDLSNQRDVLNDTLEVAKDIVITLHNSEYYTDYNVVINPFLEKYDTVLAGHSMKVILNVPYNNCEIPVTGLTLPNSTQIYGVNYKQVVNDVLQVGNNHLQLNSTGFGDLPQMVNDIVNHTEPKYSRMYVLPDQTIFNENEIKYNFNIIIYSRLEEDLSNQIDILSDTLEIIKDITTIFHNSEYYLEYDVIITPFLEEYDTTLAGWNIGINLNVPYKYNRCDIPIDTFGHKVWAFAR